MIQTLPHGFNDGWTKELPSLGSDNGASWNELLVEAAPLKFPGRNQINSPREYAFAVDSIGTGGVKVNTKVRRLTPVECERLQGFPDDWTAGVSDTQRYKMMGNAVTVNVIQAIGERILEVESQP